MHPRYILRELVALLRKFAKFECGTNGPEGIFIENLRLTRSSRKYRSVTFSTLRENNPCPVSYPARFPYTFSVLFTAQILGTGIGQMALSLATKSHTGTLRRAVSTWSAVNNSRQKRRHHWTGYNFARNASRAGWTAKRIPVSPVTGCNL